MSESWDELRKKSRNLENAIDLKLVALSKISSGGSIGDTTPLISSEFSFDTISAEVNDMLTKLADINDKMTQIKPTGNAMLHTQSRHRDILNSYRTEFNKITQNHNIKMEREELLSRSGLLSTSSSTTSSSISNRRDMYLKESQHLSNSHNMVNDQISIAIETQKSLKSQRKAFKKIQIRFNNLANAFPRINSLVQRINIKKRRDSLILGLVIAVCTILMLLYAFH